MGTGAFSASAGKGMDSYAEHSAERLADVLWPTEAVAQIPIRMDVMSCAKRRRVPDICGKYIPSGKASSKFTTPTPLLAPRSQSRASVQLHARPPASLLPASFLLNTAEWGREKQISNREHTASGRTTVLS